MLWNNNFTKIQNKQKFKSLFISFTIIVLQYKYHLVSNTHSRTRAHIHTHSRLCTQTHKNLQKVILLHIKYRMDILYMYICIYTSSFLENYFVLHVGKYGAEYFPKHTHVRSKTCSFCTNLF